MGMVADLGTLVILLPPGETSKVQVLDVGINKPFKLRVREELTRYQLEGGECVGREIMPQIVCSAWDSISASTIVGTFQHIGLVD